MPRDHETLTSLFDDIADAIRELDQTSDAIVADTFPDRILGAIPSGSIDITENDVTYNVRDYAEANVIIPYYLGEYIMKPEKYVTFTANEADSTIALNKIGSNSSEGDWNIMYSIDDGIIWQEYTLGSEITSLNIGDKVCFAGKNNENITCSTEEHLQFQMTGEWALEGNLCGLISQDTDMTTAFCFYQLFNGCDSLISISEGLLPAMTLSEGCYSNMFADCKGITSLPSRLLPATTLADNCYDSMFKYCKNIVMSSTTPIFQLRADVLAKECYKSMFEACDGVSWTPDMTGAGILAEGCYESMFFGCSGLTNIRAFPPAYGYTLAKNCCKRMFSNCPNLEQARAFTGSQLVAAEGCYEEMFAHCTGLTNIPSNVVSPKTLAKSCYEGMFAHCTGLHSALQKNLLPVTVLEESCYKSMFAGCTSLRLSTTQDSTYLRDFRIPESGTGVMASDALTDMFAGTGGSFTGTPAINTTYYMANN